MFLATGLCQLDFGGYDREILLPELHANVFTWLSPVYVPSPRFHWGRGFTAISSTMRDHKCLPGFSVAMKAWMLALTAASMEEESPIAHVENPTWRNGRAGRGCRERERERLGVRPACYTVGVHDKSKHSDDSTPVQQNNTMKKYPLRQSTNGNM